MASNGGAAGGGSESERATYFEPGSRLKPQVLRADDGVEIIEAPATSGWYDSELEIDCFFAPDPAGVERCFPLQLVTGGVMYVDANCSRPVLAAGAFGTCGGLRYDYILTDRGDCAYQGFRLGDELPPSTPLFISIDGETCNPSSATSELAPIYELEETPPETFVAVTRSARARAPGLDAYVREGADGSWQIIGHFDTERQAACFVPHAAMGPRAECLPAFASSTHFADSSCETLASEARQPACETEAPTVILRPTLDTSACSPRYDIALYDIESISETTRHELDENGQCVQGTGQPRESYVQGASIDLATLPTLETHVVGSSSVRAVFSGFGGVPYMPMGFPTPSLIDEKGEACLAFDFPDGSVRCVSTSFATTSRAALAYEDESCSGEPLVPWFPRSTCDTGALPAGVIFPDQTTQCLSRLTAMEVLAVTGKSNGSSFYTKNATTDACEAIAAASPAPIYLRLGDAIEPAELPHLQRALRN